MIVLSTGESDVKRIYEKPTLAKSEVTLQAVTAQTIVTVVLNGSST